MKNKTNNPEDLKRDTYPIGILNEDNCLIIDKNGNKSLNSAGPLDSMEEWYFTQYLKELKEHGVIVNSYKNEVPIQLSEKVLHVYTEKMPTKDKVNTKHLLHGHVYTPDFFIEWEPKWLNLFYDRYNQGIQKKGHRIPFLTTPGGMDASIIEIKGNFIQVDKATEVSNNIKWTFDKHNIFVQKVKVPKIFEETFTPKAYSEDMVYKRANSKKKIKAGDTKIKFKIVSIEDYLARIQITGSFQKSII